MSFEFRRVENGSKGEFEYLSNEKKLAEMTYVFSGDDKFIIDHTEVDDSLRGQGIGVKLVEEAVAFARKNNLRILPLCPFAKSVFDKREDLNDVRF